MLPVSSIFNNLVLFLVAVDDIFFNSALPVPDLTLFIEQILAFLLEINLAGLGDRNFSGMRLLG